MNASLRGDARYAAIRGRAATLAFPEPDTLPYDPSSPHTGITAQRLDHAEVMEVANRVKGELGALIEGVVAGL